jgi:hypothetical protein
MMASVEQRLKKAIEDRVASIPLAGYTKFSGTKVPITLSATTKYLRWTLTPNATQRVFIGSNDPHRRPYVLQIDIYERINVQGADYGALAETAAGIVTAHFQTDLRLTSDGVSVRVIKAPSPGPVFIGTAHLQRPTIIELEAYA